MEADTDPTDTWPLPELGAADLVETLLARSVDLLAVAGFDGRFRLLSRSFHELLGWSEDEMLVRPFLEQIHPDDLPETIRVMGHLSDGTSTQVGLENRYRCRDGSYRRIRWNALAHSSGLLVTVGIDVTELRETQAALERSRGQLSDARDRFAALVESSHDLIAILDDDGSIRYSSPAAAGVLGAPEAEIAGTSISSWISRADHGTWADGLARAAEVPGVPVPIELTVGRTNEQHVVGTVTDLALSSAVGGVVVNLHDVTSRKQAEDALRWQATHDGLTHLPNRASAIGHLEEAVADGEPVALLYLDLDRFKDVNDAYGHAAGDDLLVAVAERLDDEVDPDTFVSRLAGDEFLVVLRGDQAHAVQLAQRLVDRIGQDVAIADGTRVLPSVSIGVAVRMDSSVVLARGLPSTGRIWASTHLTMSPADVVKPVAAFEAYR